MKNVRLERGKGELEKRKRLFIVNIIIGSKKM